MGRATFGDFTLDADTRQLLRGADPVALSPKAYRLLELLIERSPKAQSKATLQDFLWPDTSVVEKNLANLVGEIRRALADDPAFPRFIRTVPRFGYAFTAPVEHCEAAPQAARFALVWKHGRIELREGTHVLGRDPSAELLLNSPEVSRRHALVHVDGSTVSIEDLESKNGTFVSGQRLESRRLLVDGDVIQMGSLTVTFQSTDSAAPTESW